MNEDQKSWTVARGELDGDPVITRFRSGLDAIVGSDQYGIQIGVAIPLRAALPNGWPGEAEQEELLAVEELVVEHAGDRAVLVGVITCGGMREFVLYTGAGDWTADYHHSLQDAVKTHRVQMMAKTDPAWTTYREFVPE
jgi:hypothetical protein